MKKLTALLLVLACLLTFAACEDKKKDNTEINTATGGNVYYMGDDEDIAYLKNVRNPLDPQEIYKTLPHDERILYGTYQIEGRWEDRTDFWKNTEHMTLEYWQYGELQTDEVTVFPYEIMAGPVSCSTACLDRSQQFAELSFSPSEKGAVTALCTYTVSGNTVTYTPVDYYEEIRDENYNVIELKYTLGQDSLSYTFEIDGFKLILSNGTDSITLYSPGFEPDGDPNLGGYPAIDSPKLEGLTYISGSLGENISSCYLEVNGALVYPTSAMKVWDDGRVTFYWQEKLEDGTVEEHMHHMVAIKCGSGAMILTDGETVYYYTENYLTRSLAALGQGMTTEELTQMSELTQSDLEKIEETKIDLLTDLAVAFLDAGLNVSINQLTGEIALDNTLLFAVNEYEISEEGKTFLNQFLQVYCGVVFDEKYADFISRIVVEGHTDTSGEYDYNLELSQKRADAVLTHVLSGETGIEETHVQALTQMLSAKGYSYNNPVYDENGQVDMDTSRRVAFRFIVKVG